MYKSLIIFGFTAFNSRLQSTLANVDIAHINPHTCPTCNSPATSSARAKIGFYNSVATCYGSRAMLVYIDTACAMSASSSPDSMSM